MGQIVIQLVNATSNRIPLADESVHCTVTSPPYWGLRSYGLPPRVWGGEVGCGHVWGEVLPDPHKSGLHIGGSLGADRDGAGREQAARNKTAGQFCQLCGAWRGCLGLEPTLEMYVQHIVEVFREVKRVLRNDGTVFLNLGDSYYSNPGNGRGGGSTLGGGRPHLSGLQGVRGYGIADKAKSDYRDRDCPFQSLCDGHIDSQCHHTFGSVLDPVHEQVLELCRKIQACMAELSARLSTGDSFSLQQIRRSSCAILDRLQNVIRVAEPLLAFLESMPDESFQPLLEGCHLWDSLSAFPSTLRSFAVYAQESFHKSDDTLMPAYDNQGNVEPFEELKRRTQYISAYCLLVFSCLNLPKIYPHCTAEQEISQILKPKDLVGIPWRVAFALQADGWWLRRDIIWSKTNPMPESVRDRPTTSHEYLFLLSKSKTYFYDACAVREPVSEVSLKRAEYGWNCDRPSTKNASMGGDGIHVKKMGQRFVNPAGRNRRSVWTIATKPYKGAHFATYPPALVEPCIKAGCPPGGIVLDPFVGSGTTLMVARALKRSGIGLDLSFDYLSQQARKRLELDKLEAWEHGGNSSGKSLADLPLFASSMEELI